MRETARLAGFFAAHGIWRVCGGATLIPLLGYEQADGTRGMDRFVCDDSADAVLTGQDALEANRRGSACAVLVIDAYVQLDTGRTDALIIEAVKYGPAGQSMKMAVPYRPESAPEGLPCTGLSSLRSSMSIRRTAPPRGEAFFDGAGSHEPAAAVWDAHLDQTG